MDFGSNFSVLSLCGGQLRLRLPDPLTMDETGHEAGDQVPVSSALSRVIEFESAAPPHMKVSLKIQKAIPSSKPPVVARDDWTNAALDRAWELEVNTVLELSRRDAPGVVTMVCGIQTDRVQPSDFRHVPVVYCRAKQVFFTPMCPVTLTPLSDCHDEERLHEAGLPSYSNSGFRYLCGRATAPSYEDMPFYTATAEGRSVCSDPNRVRVGGELLEDLARIVGRFENKGVPQAVASALEYAFPCLTCDQRAECFPPERNSAGELPANRHLKFLSFHDFWFLPLKARDCDLVEASHIIGGMPRRNSQGHHDTEYPASVTADYMSPSPRSRTFLTEVLWLKLSLFAQLLQGVMSYYQVTQRQHLGLSADAVSVAWGSSPPALPRNWTAALAIGDPVSALPLWVFGIEGNRGGLIVPSRHAAVLSAYAEYCRNMTGAGQVNLVVRELRDGNQEIQVQFEVQGDSVVLSHIADANVLTVVLPDGEPFSSGIREFECTYIGERDGEVVIGAILKGRPPLAGWEEPLAAGRTIWNCRLAAYRQIPATSDIKRLGWLYHEMLLTNDRLTAAGLQSILNEIIPTNENKGVPHVIDPGQSCNVWTDHLGRVLGAREILYAESLRKQIGARSLPVWRDTLRLGIEMLSGMNPLPNAPAAASPLDECRRRIACYASRLETLRDKVRAELTAPREWPSLDREDRTVLSEVLSEYGNQTGFCL